MPRAKPTGPTYEVLTYDIGPVYRGGPGKWTVRSRGLKKWGIRRALRRLLALGYDLDVSIYVQLTTDRHVGPEAP